jgi:pSer/pThr/pTyr-binding forkhead associated (FHA) protein
MVPESFAKLVLTQPDGGAQEVSLSKGNITVGRAATSDIVLRDGKASRAHARFECGPGGCFVVDLGSANGTRVNGSRVERVRLQTGDSIQIGDTLARFDAAALELDAEETRVDTEAELEATLVATPVPMQLEDTRSPRLAVHMPGRTWEVALIKDAVTIGRHPDNDIVLPAQKVSRHHAVIERRGDGFRVRDLRSDNGTYVGPHRVESHDLAEDDTVTIGNARLIFKPGFDEQELTVVETPGQRAARRPVVIVPGFLGSNLYQGNERVWPNVRYLVTSPEMLAIREGGPVFEPRGLIDEVVIMPNLIKQEQYGTLIDYLEEALGYERGKDLLPFGYDFRSDIRVSARHLAEAIEKWAPKRPITILAHSMGSLVSRYYIENVGGKKRVERLVCMGGPHAGAPKALTYLLLGLSIMRIGSVGERLRNTLATFPSFYQLFPAYHCGVDQHGKHVDWLSDCTWVNEEFRPYLRYGAELHAELGQRSSVPAVCIFGYGMKTATHVRIERNAAGGCLKSEVQFEPGGDGTVPESSAILEGAEIHPVRQYHGTLHVDQDVKKRLKVELTR